MNQMYSINSDLTVSTVGVAVSASPFDFAAGDTNSIALQHRSSIENETEPHIWKDVADHIYSLGSRLHRNYSENDWTMKEHLDFFADHIDETTTEIAADASMLLEEFKSFSSSSHFSLGFSGNDNDLPEPGDDFFRLIDTPDKTVSMRAKSVTKRKSIH